MVSELDAVILYQQEKGLQTSYIHLGFIVRVYLKHWNQYKIKVMLHGTIRSDDF